MCLQNPVVLSHCHGVHTKFYEKLYEKFYGKLICESTSLVFFNIRHSLKICRHSYSLSFVQFHVPNISCPLFTGTDIF